MELVALKCPKCGGELEVHEGQKKTFCKYCGSQILLDDGNRIINVIDEAKGTYENDVYTSDLYTFKIDSKKWAMQESAGVDVMFTYADAGDDAELESASINVISMSNDLLNGLTASDYADQIKQTYNSMDGYTVTNDKEDKFAGKDAYIVDVTGEIGSQKVLLNQIITSDNGNLVVITYGASENAYSKLSDEFKTVLDSFELK